MEAWPIKALKAAPISLKGSNLWQALPPPIAESLRGKIEKLNETYLEVEV